MNTIKPCKLDFRLLVVMWLCALLVSGSSYAADTENSEELKILDDGTFVHGGTKPAQMSDGFSLSKEFIDVASSNTLALHKFQEAQTYQNISFAGTVALTGYTLKMLMDTLDDKSNLEDGKPVDGKFEISSVVPVLVSAIVIISASTVSKSRMNEGLRLFNQKYVENSRTQTISYSLDLDMDQSGSNLQSPNLMATLSIRF